MSQKYVPDGCWLRCDKGALPTQLKVTNHNNTSIYGDNLASEADKVPNVNIMPFGVCSITHGPCQPLPLYWDKCIQGVKVNGKKLIVGEAKLFCSLGGQASIFYSKADAMAAGGGAGSGGGAGGANTPLGDGITGGGIGIENGQRFLANEFGALAREASAFNPDGTPAPGTDVKGNFGEIRTTMDLKMRGYQMTSTTQAATLTDPTHQGLDLSARDAKGSTDIIADAKYKSTAGPPRMESTTNSGRQMSNQWLRSPVTPGGPATRIEEAMPAADAQRVNNKILTNSDDLTRVAAKIEPNGTVSYYELDNAGNTARTVPPGGTRARIDPPVDIPAANVMRGNSRAANFINGVSRNIQATGGIRTANQWLVRNAHTVSRVGRVVGRGAIVIGIVTEGINIHNAYQADGGQVGTNTKHAIGSAAGALAGGLAGAKLGAMVGALGGPVGIIVGGVVGGVIGGIAGGFLGDKIGGWF